MKIVLSKNLITIKDCQTFDIKKSLECGQIFRYLIERDKYILFETDNKVEIYQNNNEIIIKTNNPQRYLNYFDLETDYDKINMRISKFNPFIRRAVDFGKGVRIFKQDLIETIINFVISANNNIPRIQKSLFLLCEKHGEDKGDYFGFPTLMKLCMITEQQWKDIGVGYRSSQLVKLCQQLKELNINALRLMTTQEARRYLIKLSGIGPKVADCVLLFGLNKTDSFPTDTWIKKIYLENFYGSEKDADKISKELVSQFKEDSGIIQQYLFYFKREKGDR